MQFSKRILVIAAVWLVSPLLPAAEPLLGGAVESISCFQNGQLIFRTQERLREFLPGQDLSLLADINLGQVQETRVRIYGADRAELVCIISGRP
jgi:hypothetical protein